ncbi:hypothetical protein MTO96_036469 [Rhipicephalus appendiculatus]
MLYTESPVCVTPWTYMNWRNSQPTLICLHDMPYDDFDDSSVVHVLSLESTFSYCAETSETIISKVKKWLAVVAPKRHGFAFYDMEMGDVNNACSKGAFYRIAQLKQYLRT